MKVKEMYTTIESEKGGCMQETLLAWISGMSLIFIDKTRLVCVECVLTALYKPV